MILRSFIIGWFLVCVSPAWPNTNSSNLHKMNSLLDFWDISKAESSLNILPLKIKGDDYFNLSKARLEFMKGSYESAWSFVKNIKPSRVGGMLLTKIKGDASAIEPARI